MAIGIPIRQETPLDKWADILEIVNTTGNDYDLGLKIRKYIHEHSNVTDETNKGKIKGNNPA